MVLTRQKTALALTVLGLLAASFFVPTWWRGQVFGTFDLGHISIPLEDTFAHYQHQGIVPVWAPEFQTGYPLLANGLHSFFYPPHMLLRQFLSGVWVLNISLLVHLWLAAAGMWLLLRRAGVNRGSAFCGATAFMAGGYFVGRVTLSHLFLPATWLPLLLWLWWRAWDQGSLRAYFLAAAANAWQLLSGHPQIVVYSGVAIAWWLAVLTWHSPRSGRWQRWLKVIGTALAVVLLSAIHILPIQELTPLSVRAAPLTGQEAFDVSYPWRQSLAWLWPTVFGRGDHYLGAKNEPELMIYGGVMMTMLIVLALGSKRMWRTPLGQTSVGLVIGGLLLAGGEFSPVYRLLFAVLPPLQRLANPGRAVFLVSVGAAILTGYGFEVLGRWPSWARVTVAGLLVVELAYWGLGVNPTLPQIAWARLPRIASVIAPGKEGRVFSTTHLSPLPDFGPTVGMQVTKDETVDQAFVPQRSMLQAIAVQLTWNGAPSAPGHVRLQLLRQGHLEREVTIEGQTIGQTESVLFAFAPLAVEPQDKLLLRLDSSYVQKGPSVILETNIGHSDYDPTGQAHVCLRGQCQAIVTDNGLAQADLAFEAQYPPEALYLDRELLLPVLGESLGYEMVRGHLTLQLQRMYDYMYALGERSDLDTSQLKEQRALLDRLGVGFLVGAFPPHRTVRDMANIEEVGHVPASQEDIRAYRNLTVFPRWQLVGSLITVHDAAEALAQLKTGTVGTSSVVAENVDVPANIGTDQKASIVLQNRQLTAWHFQIQSLSPQFLVVRDANYVGWQAFIDGRPTPIYPTDVVFRGVLVPAGSHQVEISYHPRAFYRGAWISAVAWLVVFGGIVWVKPKPKI